MQKLTAAQQKRITMVKIIMLEHAWDIKDAVDIASLYNAKDSCEMMHRYASSLNYFPGQFACDIGAVAERIYRARVDKLWEKENGVRTA